MKIGIVGAGTAGLATAIAFAQRGHQVSVYEKHPSLATLGAGLLIQPQGVDALDRLGVGAAFSEASVPINHLLGKTHRNWTIVDVPYRRQAARAVSRSALAQLLLEAALAARAEVRFGARVQRVAADAGAGTASIDGEMLAFDLLVIADGAASVLPEQAGLAVAASRYQWGALWSMFDVDDWAGPERLEQRYRSTSNMYGLMPTARVDGKLRLSLFWSLPCDAYAGWQASPLEAWKAELLALWPESEPVVAQIRSHQQMTFASYHHASPRQLALPSICIVGDAAHAMSPQLGLGATLAVQDALVLAAMVDRHGPADGPLRYSRARLPTVRGYQLLSRALTPCFQAHGSGWWRDMLFAAGLFIPGVPKLMHRSVAEPF